MENLNATDDITTTNAINENEKANGGNISEAKENPNLRRKKEDNRHEIINWSNSKN